MNKVARTPEHQRPPEAAGLLAENETIDDAPLSGEVVLVSGAPHDILAVTPHLLLFEKDPEDL